MRDSAICAHSIHSPVLARSVRHQPKLATAAGGNPRSPDDVRMLLSHQKAIQEDVVFEALGDKTRRGYIHRGVSSIIPQRSS